MNFNVTMNWIKWPEWANYLAFDNDGSSVFCAKKPEGQQFGVWDIEGRYEDAEQNEDFEVSHHGNYPKMTFYTKPDYSI